MSKNIDIAKVYILAEEMYNKLAEQTSGPAELGFILFVMHISLYKMECSITAKEFMKEYVRDFLIHADDVIVEEDRLH